MVKIASLDNAFSAIFELDESPVEGQSLQQKDKKRRKRKGKKIIIIKKKRRLKTYAVGHFPNFDFCTCWSKNVVKRDFRGEKGVLSCCNAFLGRLELIWPISRVKTISFPEPMCLLVSAKTWSPGIINFHTPRF